MGVDVSKRYFLKLEFEQHYWIFLSLLWEDQYLQLSGKVHPGEKVTFITVTFQGHLYLDGSSSMQDGHEVLRFFSDKKEAWMRFESGPLLYKKKYLKAIQYTAILCYRGLYCFRRRGCWQVAPFHQHFTWPLILRWRMHWWIGRWCLTWRNCLTSRQVQTI